MDMGASSAARPVRRERPGRLRVFFGAAPGVGKTEAMLDEARARRAAGVPLRRAA